MGIERLDGECRADGHAVGELELLTVAAEMEREFTAGEAFAVERVDEAPCPRAGHERTVGERRARGQQAGGRARLDRRRCAVQDVEDRPT